MKTFFYISTIIIMLIACNNSNRQEASTHTDNNIQGTWKLLSGTTIEKTDTAVTDYTKAKSFIKVINATHFAFMGHDLDKGKDTATIFYSSGGGRYSLNDSAYTEHLEYCNDRQWENNSFNFTVSISNDTLIQKGIEKIDSIGVNRINIEKYVRLK